MSARTYRMYLGVDQLEKRLNRFGVTYTSITMDLDTKYRAQEADEITDGKVPFYWRYPEVRVGLTDSGFQEDLPEDLDYSYDEGSPYQQAIQQKREEFIRKFSAAYPSAEVFRQGGYSYIFWKALDDIGVGISIERALCERVLVREDIEEVPDPELLEEALKDIPKVKKVRPVYEYRCNDAEFFDTTSAESGVRVAAES